MSDQEKDTSPGRKENSSHNAATHGLSCKKCFLIGDETEEEFSKHAQSWRDQYAEYSTPALESLLQDLIEAHWLQKRAYRRIFESESALANAEANRDPMTDEIFRRLRNIQRYKTSYENSFQKAFRTVEAFCKNRISAQVSESRDEHIQASTHAVLVRSLQRLTKLGQLTPDEARKATLDFCDRYSSAPESNGSTG